MADIAEAFEQHLRSLTDDEWTALTQRVRTPQQQQPSERQRLDNESDAPATKIGKGRNAGLEEAKRRGFIDNDGKPVKR